MMVGVAIRPPLPISRRHYSEQAMSGLERSAAGRGNPLQRTHEAPAIAIELTRTRPLDPGIVQGIGGHTARPPRRQPQPEVLCERPSPDTNRLRPGPLERHHFAGIAKVTDPLVRRERAPVPRRLGSNAGKTIGQRLKDGRIVDGPEDCHGLRAL